MYSKNGQMRWILILSRYLLHRMDTIPFVCILWIVQGPSFRTAGSNFPFNWFLLGIRTSWHTLQSNCFLPVFSRLLMSFTFSCLIFNNCCQFTLLGNGCNMFLPMAMGFIHLLVTSGVETYSNLLGGFTLRLIAIMVLMDWCTLSTIILD